MAVENGIVCLRKNKISGTAVFSCSRAKTIRCSFQPFFNLRKMDVTCQSDIWMLSVTFENGFISDFDKKSSIKLLKYSTLLWLHLLSNYPKRKMKSVRFVMVR